jgi:NAD(P)-dependent dehydrogenase (short-subunit alcohol dehydrogenase family)
VPDSPLSPAHLFSLEGRTALVTGGSLGIGAMIAEGLVAAGARVLLAARNAAELADAAERLSAIEGAVPCEGVAADLGSTEGCRALVAEVARRTDELHIVVHSAGTTALRGLEDHDDAEWDRVMDLNVKAVHVLTGLLVPMLTASATAEDPARVVVIGSTSGMQTSGLPDFAYGASKAAAHHLVRYLAGALADRHVLVNAIAPGLFPTRMSAFLDHEAIRDPVLSTIPLRRAGRPEEIAGAALFLVSRAGGYTTGQVLVVDGGRQGIGRADPVAGL